MMTEIQSEPEQLQDGSSSFMSVYKDIVWRVKGNEELCIANSQNCSRMCGQIRARTVVVSWACIRKEMVRNPHIQAHGEWDRVAEDMMINFSESGHSVFRASSAIGTRRKQRKRTHVCTFLW